MISKAVTPSYRHFCGNCQYVGFVKRMRNSGLGSSLFDVYLCGPDHVVVRYGNNASEEATLRKGYLHPEGFIRLDKSVAREALLLATNTAPEQLYIKEV